MEVAAMQANNVYIEFGTQTPRIGGWERYDSVMQGCCVIGQIETVRITRTDGTPSFETRSCSDGLSKTGVDVDWIFRRNGKFIIPDDMIGFNFGVYPLLSVDWGTIYEYVVPRKHVLDWRRQPFEIAGWYQTGIVSYDGERLLGQLERGIVHDKRYGKMWHDSHVNHYGIDFAEFLRWNGVNVEPLF
jgi:hypothetical protein